MKRPRQQRLIWRIFPTYIAVILICVTAFSTVAYNSFTQFYYSKMEQVLKDAALLSASQAVPYYNERRFKDLDRDIANFIYRPDIRLTASDENGVIIADSLEFPQNFSAADARPEFKEALLGNESVVLRLSHTMDRVMLYVALPVEFENQVIGAVRAGTSVADIDYVLWDFYKHMIVAGLIIILVSGIASWFLAHYWVRPIRTLRLGVERIARGDLTSPIPKLTPKEMNTLAVAVNAMAKQMDARIQAIIHERNEKAAILAKMEKLERMRKEFVANVSHELKTPITLIKGFVETLEEGGVDDEEDRQKFLGIIRNHSDRLSAIIEDLLSLSRIEQDEGYGMELEDTNPAEIIERVIGHCEPTAEDKSITIHSVFPDNLKSIPLNGALMEQAIMNLVVNAIRYSSKKTEVTISIQQTESNTKILIKDQGRGIDEKHIPYLFQRFYRVDKARSRQMGGTGLGLAIVKHILQAHKGDIKVESVVCTGSTFILTVPNNLSQNFTSIDALALEDDD
ncbi:MAG: ATP-binding protein [bacterium]|nr:ATP-binding protein [bacterium]